MKILFFADLHGDMKTLAKLREKASEVDIVASAGDMTTMENNIQAVVQKLATFRKPVMMIHGNHEDAGRLRDMCSKYKSLIFLHKGVHHLNDYAFMGYGGDGFSTTDQEFDRIAERFFAKEAEGKRRVIMMTHGPPYGTEIDNINGEHRGSKSYRKFLDTVRPHLFIAGHLHETAGKHEKIGRTLIINPGKTGVVVEI